MDAWLESSAAAARLLLMIVVGWVIIFLISRMMEQRLRGSSSRRRRAPGMLSALGWLWDYSNVIGIPTLLLGAVYLIWAMNWGGGLASGPTMLVILLMSVAAFLVGFGPGLRRP